MLHVIFCRLFDTFLIQAQKAWIGTSMSDEAVHVTTDGGSLTTQLHAPILPILPFDLQVHSFALQ